MLKYVPCSWLVKHRYLLDEYQGKCLANLNQALNSGAGSYLFGEVSEDRSMTIALDLGQEIRVRISTYFGDFSSFYLSFFHADDIIRQEHLDFENTVKAVRKVYESLNSK